MLIVLAVPVLFYGADIAALLRAFRKWLLREQPHQQLLAPLHLRLDEQQCLLPL
jgi:hypothetical protein